MRTALRSIAVVLLASLNGCGGGGDAPAGMRTEYGRLQLRTDRPPSDTGAPRVTRTLRFEPGTPSWNVRAGVGEVIQDPREPDGAGAWLLALTGKGPKVLVLPGPFEAHGFERVALELAISRSESVRVGAVLENGETLLSRSVEVAVRPGPQAVVFDIPQLRLRSAPVRELSIRFRGDGGNLGVYRVDWLSQPVSGWLPRVGDAPRAVQLGSETRLVCGFTSQEQLTARFEAQSGEVLSFAYGVPHELGVDGGRPRLGVRVSAGEEAIERGFALAAQGDASLWQEALIELDAFAGEEVEVELTLRAPQDTPVVCALGDVRVRDPRREAPLVFVMTSDTHRADHIGVARMGVEIDTPTFDAIAERGVWFANCWSSTNVTSPSHVALMTGVHPRDHGVVTNLMQLADQAPTLAEAFRDAGWATMGVVSNSSLGPLRCGLEQGFDRFAVPERSHPGDAEEAIDRLLAWWPTVDGVPRFCWLHVFDAHEPYAPPVPSLVERYYPSGRDPFDPDLPPLEGITDANLPESLRGLRDLAWPRASYRAEITYLDEQLARLVEGERFEGAIIAITADHGESLEAHGVYYNHADLYPDSLHVPLILAWPGAPAGTRIERPVEQVWVGRTVLDLAGLDATAFPGQDLRASMAPTDPAAGPRYALSAGRRTASITAWPWHLTMHLRRHVNPGSSATNHEHAVRLFDLERDPGCLDDLVARRAEPERARVLRARLIEWLNDGAPLEWGREGDRSPEVLAELAKLGYATDDTTTATSELVDSDCDCAWCARFR